MASPTRDNPIRISCDDCSMQGTSACDDCLVTFICSREPGDAVIIDAAEVRAMRQLAEGGLVPRLRHQRRGSSSSSSASGADRRTGT